MTPPKIKLDRIDRTISNLPKAVYESIAGLNIEAWVTKEPATFAERTHGEHKILTVGDTWGELWDCAWFHLTGPIPDQAKGKTSVALIDFNGEGLVVDTHGNPWQGLTTISSEFDFSLGRPGKKVVPLGGDEQVDLWIDVGLNDLFGRLPNGGRLEEAQIAIKRENVQALCFDFEVLRELLNQVPNQKARYSTILQSLYDAAILLANGASDDAVDKARERLKPELDKQGGSPSLTISALGHAHIDLAWLWPIRETIRKGARTFSTVMRMMERYPDYKFGASQPQLYQWMKDHYPTLYEEVKERVKEGRWEVQGAMWVEPDCNIPSGESLVRQILYGKRFFRQEFGKDVTNLWEPDVFGYSGSIPQILRKAGIDTFMTQKLSWSTFNKHPHHTFHWEGIDGSSVLVHMPPEATYNSSAAPRAIARAENDYLDKEVSGNCLLLFGIGDGGGGPGEEHLERLAREKNLDGLAPVVQEFSEVFFDKLKGDAENYARWRGELYLERHQGTLTSQARNKRFNRKLELALRELELAAVRAMPHGHPYPSADLDRIWKEMLLLQFHDILPGSSITRVFDESRTRYAAMLAEVEALTAAADRATPMHETDPEGVTDDSPVVEDPGVTDNSPVVEDPEVTDNSPVVEDPEVTDNSPVVEDPEVKDNSPVVKDPGVTDISPVHESDPAGVADNSPVVEDPGNPNHPKNPDPGGVPDSLAVTNSLSWDRREWIKIGAQWFDLQVGPLSVCRLHGGSEPPTVTATKNKLENEFLAVRLNANGEIDSIFDKQANRELLRPGSVANRLAVYDDQGDAWDFPFDYDIPGSSEFELVSKEAEIDGPQAVLRQNRRFGTSTLTQEIVLTAGNRRLDFKTKVDWQERRKMLRTSFPVAIETSKAKCEIQFGHIERPTHGNTSWDWAQGEICAQKWIDISEETYGVALLNDCKYGHKIKDGILDLNLLRSPAYPDPIADQGEHEFTYSLFPHLGDCAEGGVVRAAWELNVPLRVVSRVGPIDQAPLLEISLAHQPTPKGSHTIARWSKTPGTGPDLNSDPEGVAESHGIVVEAIKKAEDDDSIVVRLYESHGATTTVAIKFGFDLVAANLVDLMEENPEPLAINGRTVETTFRPFEIVTLKVTRR